MATWDNASGVKGYLLDVSTSDSFSTYVDGYHGLDVGDVNGRAVTGLNPGTTYYYRVRPYTAAGSEGYSSVITATTTPGTGLIIHATFDAAISGSPTIQATINRAIAIYESLFSDPITIQIRFRYADTGPEPSATPYPSGVLSQSFFVPYDIPWNDFVSALRADATTSNDNEANASLPGSALSTNIAPSSANGRAVGLNTPPAMFADGHIGPGGPYDGIVTLNSAQPFWFTRPLVSGSYDAQRSVEHEIDEVIGFGSQARPATCASSYEAESSENTISGGAGIQSCPTCSGGAKVVYVGNNSGTLQFNGVTANATHSYVVTIWYLNGAGTRYALLSVNGSQGTPVSFPSTGSFHTVGSVHKTVVLHAGSDNTLEFYNPVTGEWAADFDAIGVNCSVPAPTNLRPQDLFSWSSPGVRNFTSNASRYFSINGGSTNIVGFNQTPFGDFGDWLSEACPQTHPYVQNAFGCPDQYSDISATSPEGINLDVIGYDLGNTLTPTPGRAIVGDFNGGGHPDYVVHKASTHQTAIWYLNNSDFIDGAFGPTLLAGWGLRGTADFNRDGHPDYALFNSSTRRTAIWYLNNNALLSGTYGPFLPSGWQLVATGDFNGDGKPDYVLYHASTRRTAIWYMNNNAFVSGVYGPTLPAGYALMGLGDFNRDGKLDYLLFNPSTRQSAIWYLNNNVRVSAGYGPTIASGYVLTGTTDFNRDGKPDYLLYNPSTHRTAIWYLNNNVYTSGAYGPTLPSGWSLMAP